MRPKLSWMVAIFLGINLSCTTVEPTKPSVVENQLWYKQPAKNWMQALPLGNGRLGAMVFGDTKRSHIQLNEDSMWAGGPDWGDAKGNAQELATIRNLLKAGKTREVDSLLVEKFSYKSILRSHQTLGDLFIEFKGDQLISNYKRNLNLEKALSTVQYQNNTESYTQKTFCSAPDDVLMIQLETSDINGMNFTLNLQRPDDHDHPTVEVENPSVNEISMKGMVTQYGGKKESAPLPILNGVKFETRLKVKLDSGTVTPINGTLEIKGAKKATLYLVANTSFYHGENYESENDKTLAKVYDQSFTALLSKHVADYQQFYKRVDLDLGGQALDSLPTDKRLTRVKAGETDVDLISKLFQYGRYLLISSSRQGTNPANLQGIWNNHIEAPWNADYHLNINLQMNYWPAEVTNLTELHEPFFDLLDRVIARGKITAKEQYGIDRGSVIHHATDLWATAWMRAAQAYWGSWIHGGGWSVQHYWEHYAFTRNKTFLKERGYPALKTVAEFYLDWLVWDEKSQSWVSTPETSPENSYIAANGKPAAVSFGSAMGHQIINEVFKNTLQAAEVLGIDDDFIAEVKAKKASLHPGVILGDDGRILEWNEPYEEAEKGHRHMSHLYALHPGVDITPKDTAAFEGAKKTIAYRLEHGGAGTGWSRAWMINLNARLLDSLAAQKNIQKFMQISVADNLFDEHPPFQIDGNFGFTAGIAELLLQSHTDEINILPTLPPGWTNGSITGLKARGNITVDIYWENKKLRKVLLRSSHPQTIKLRYKDTVIALQLIKDKSIALDGTLKLIKN